MKLAKQQEPATPKYDVREDAAVVAATDTLNELSRKKTVLDEQIAACDERIRGDWSLDADSRAASTVAEALALVPGSKVTPILRGPLDDEKERSITLRAQREAVSRAIEEQQRVLERACRDAGIRVFKREAGPYLAKAEEMLALVERIPALNAELHAFWHALYVGGAVDTPSLRYPLFRDHSDTVTNWNADLREAIERAREAAGRE